MADAGLSDLKNLLGDVLGKLTSLETKLTAVDHELSTVKHDEQLVHDAVQAGKQQAAYPIELRLPEYDGTDDPDVWLHRFEIFFDLQRTEEEKKVLLAAFHMTGAAQIWYHGVERNRGVPTWPEFAESVRRRFFGYLTRGDDAFRKLIQLRQTRSVAEYREEFLGLVDRCDGVNEVMQLVFFTGGLRDPLRADVELRQPATLRDAAWMAGVLEHREKLGFEK